MAGIALLIPAGRRGAIPPRGSSVARLSSRTWGPVALAPRPNPASAAPPLRRAGAKAPSPPGGRPTLPSWVGLLRPQRPPQDWRQWIDPERSPGLPVPAPRRGVPWAGKRQVCQSSVACWIEASPPPQRGPWRPAYGADSPGDPGRIGGRAPRAGALAAAPGAPRHPGPGQRPLRPHAGSGPAGGETRVAAAATAASSVSWSPSPPPPPPSPLGGRGDAGGIAGPRRMRPPPPLGLRRLAGMKHRP